MPTSFLNRSLTLKLALKGLVHQRRFSLAIIMNIALGVCGFLIVGIFKESFQAELATRTKSIAAGDLVVSARVPTSPELIARINNELPKPYASSEERGIVTMIAANDRSRLIELRFVDRAFPLYGTFIYQDKSVVGNAPIDSGFADIYPELQTELGLNPGDSFTVGQLTVKVRHIIQEDPSNSAGNFNFAPRAYLSLEDSAKTGLFELGSRVFWVWRYQFNPTVDIVSLEKNLKNQFAKEPVRIRSHHTSSEDASRLQTYLTDYLGLVSLASLFLALVGASYLMRGHLTRSLKEYAILLSVGSHHRRLIVIYLLQITVLTCIGILLAFVSAKALSPLLADLLKPITGDIPIVQVPGTYVLLGSSICLLSSIMVSLPQLASLFTLSPGVLFREAAVPSLNISRWNWLWYLPMAALWWIAAIAQVKSIVNGTIFALSFLGSAIVLGILGFLCLRLVLYFNKRLSTSWTVRLALTQLVRNPLATMSAFLALSLGSTLLNVIPQVRVAIAKEIERPDSVLPQFFMFDIQDEQLAPIQQFIDTLGAKLNSPSPMIRARLEKINGIDMSDRTFVLEAERDQEQRESMQSRMQNLSYRDALRPAETLVAGTFQGAKWQEGSIPEISLEEQFAKRIDVSMGDVMTFDISGVRIEGRITSLRKVKWTTFEPNFFIVFQPGVLEDAPKIFLASVSGVDPLQKTQIQGQITKQWANVSVVDIKSAIQRIITLIDQIIQAITFIALLALITGFTVVFSICTLQAEERKLNFALLKSLGSSLSSITKSTLIETGLIALFASVSGMMMGLIVSGSIATLVFKTTMPISLGFPLILTVIVTGSTLVLTFLATRGFLRYSVSSLLSR